jgi:hypothetical protein
VQYYRFLAGWEKSIVIVKEWQYCSKQVLNRLNNTLNKVRVFSWFELQHSKL